MAKVPNGVEILPKISNAENVKPLSMAHERYMVTDRRETDDRRTNDSIRSLIKLLGCSGAFDRLSSLFSAVVV